MNKPAFDPNQPYDSTDSKPAFNPDQPYQSASVAPKEDDPDTGSTLLNIGKGLFKGPSMGEYMPIVGPAVANASRAAVAAAQTPFSNEGFMALYKKQRDQDEADRKKYEHDYPAAANVKAAFGTAMLPLGKVAEAVAPGVGWLAGLARGGVNTAEGAVVAGGDQLARGNSDEALPAAEEALKTGGMIQGGMSALHGAGLAYSRLAAGLRPETLQKYIDRRPEINALQEPNLVDEARNSLDEVQGRYNQGKENIQGDMKRSIMSNRDNAKMEVDRAREANQKARAEVDNKYQTRVLEENAATQAAKQKGLADSAERGQNINQRADLLERQGADSIADMMRRSGKKIGEASREAMSTLDNHEGEIGLNWYRQQLKKGIDQNRFGNKLLPNEGVDQLVKYKGLLTQEGVDAVPAKDMKRLIQSLDADLSDAYSKAQNGNYNTPAIKNLMTMRRLASARLKMDVPGYGEAMKPVASMVGKIKGLQKDIPVAEGDKVYSKIKNLDGLGKQDFRQKLSAAESEFGGTGLNKIDQANALRELDPTRGQTFDTPNQQFLDYLKANRTQGLSQLEQKMKTAQAGSMARKAAAEQQIVGNANQQLSPLNEMRKQIGGMGDDSIQNRLRRMGGDPNNNLVMKEKMENLGRLTGKPEGYFAQQADDLAVKRAMEGSNTRGSRNVNLGAYSLHGFAKMLGLDSAAEGAKGLGAMLGAVSDVAGPKIVKAVVDLGMSNAGIQARAALRKAALSGPQVFAQEHARLLREDPEYAKAFH